MGSPYHPSSAPKRANQNSNFFFGTGYWSSFSELPKIGCAPALVPAEQSKFWGLDFLFLTIYLLFKLLTNRKFQFLSILKHHRISMNRLPLPLFLPRPCPWLFNGFSPLSLPNCFRWRRADYPISTHWNNWLHFRHRLFSEESSPPWMYRQLKKMTFCLLQLATSM